MKSANQDNYAHSHMVEQCIQVIYEIRRIHPLDRVEGESLRLGVALHTVAMLSGVNADLFNSSVDATTTATGVLFDPAPSKAWPDQLPAQQIAYLVDNGTSVESIVEMLWPGMTFDRVIASYSVDSIRKAWSDKGWELISTGGGFGGATKVNGGVRFNVTDYEETSYPNPLLPLSLTAYNYESDEYLQFNELCPDLTYIEQRILSWTEDLQLALVDSQTSISSNPDFPSCED